jgi:cyclic pyranopterin phosphate synthase
VGDFTHLDGEGRARMVDVSGKPVTLRRAVAEAALLAPPEVMAALRAGPTPKGDVLAAARLAGVMAAKRTASLIPLCHTIPLDHVRVELEPREDRVAIRAEAVTRAPTGVEMEALTAAAIAGLTLYDMLKALSHAMVLEGLRLVEKSGGASGDWYAPEGPL